MITCFDSAISSFGFDAKRTLSSIPDQGSAEEQLRSPLKGLLSDLAGIIAPKRKTVIVGDTALSKTSSRPDFAIEIDGALTGFVALKAPGKGVSPGRFRGYDKEQWEKLKALPNLIYSDGNGFSLWRDGKQVGETVQLQGDIATAGERLCSPIALQELFSHFMRWHPVPPRDTRQLALTVGRLGQLFKEEVREEVEAGNTALMDLKAEWQSSFLPHASSETFADSFAHTVTFGLLAARARNMALQPSIALAAEDLKKLSPLFGRTLGVLAGIRAEGTLRTSLDTLARVLDVVFWQALSINEPKAWHGFYDDFLECYDNDLRKQNVSHHTPSAIVSAMVRLVDDLLASQEFFATRDGLAHHNVFVVDPAFGTGAFLTGVLKRIAWRTKQFHGAASVDAVLKSAADRLNGFEQHLGPFAFTQLRLIAETMADDSAPHPDHASDLSLFVTQALANSDVEEDFFHTTAAETERSHRRDDGVGSGQPITVIIGKPTYGKSSNENNAWVENVVTQRRGDEAPLIDTWRPPVEWAVGAHAKHLKKPYVYFWRWATWKVFGPEKVLEPKTKPSNDRGIIAYITVAGFLNGPGFQKMRSDLRRDCDAIWVIDCTPESHRPRFASRILERVQQQVCIVIAAKTGQTNSDTPATVKFASLPLGGRRSKFEHLERISLTSGEWREGSTQWRASFLPKAEGIWAESVLLDDFFVYTGSGIMPGRTWVIAPDVETLEKRWRALQNEPNNQRRQELFHPHLSRGNLGDRHLNKRLSKALTAKCRPGISVGDDTQSLIKPMRYALRSFDRQWIIPDDRLINRPNPKLWSSHSHQQIYLTALRADVLKPGPAVTATTLLPDMDHFNGRGGRVFPLWLDAECTTANVRPGLLAECGEKGGLFESGSDVIAYISAVTSHPYYVQTFETELHTPGLRVPIAASQTLRNEAIKLGKEILWLHSFGTRFVSETEGRPAGPPRVQMDGRLEPHIPDDGEISESPADMPDTMSYDTERSRINLGTGFIEPVSRDAWDYEVSGKNILRQWFSYRKKDRSRTKIGERRSPASLETIQAHTWRFEYTQDLIEIIRILERLIRLENQQADLLDRICASELIRENDLRAAGVLNIPEGLGPEAKNWAERR